MAKGQPNDESMTINFVPKAWDPIAEEFKPLYIAPDATQTERGDVWLSDEVDGTDGLTDDIRNATSGVTAATPAAVKTVYDKIANTKVTVKNGSAPQVVGTLNAENNIEIDLSQLDASTLSIGMVPIERLPHGALERLVKVQNKAERFALKRSTGLESEDNNYVSNGDTVLQLDTNVMYIVIDDTQLSSEAGYQEYSAGTATQATRLVEKRNFITNLASTTPGSFDGTSDVTLGVIGKLPTDNVADQAITLPKLSNEVETVHIGTDQPTNKHVKIWIDLTE